MTLFFWPLGNIFRTCHELHTNYCYVFSLVVFTCSFYTWILLVSTHFAIESSWAHWCTFYVCFCMNMWHFSWQTLVYIILWQKATDNTTAIDIVIILTCKKLANYCWKLVSTPEGLWSTPESFYFACIYTSDLIKRFMLFLLKKVNLSDIYCCHGLHSNLCWS